MKFTIYLIFREANFWLVSYIMASGCKFIQRKRGNAFTFCIKTWFYVKHFHTNYFSNRTAFVPDGSLNLINFKTLLINKVGMPSANVSVLNQVMAKVYKQTECLILHPSRILKFLLVTILLPYEMWKVLDFNIFLVKTC